MEPPPAPLTEAITPVTPSPAVWTAIEARIAQDRYVERGAIAPSLWDRIGFWRWSAIAATAVAALLMIYVGADFRRPAGEQVAVLTSPQGSPAVVVSADARQRALTVRALADAPSGHTHELWIITGANRSHARSAPWRRRGRRACNCRRISSRRSRVQHSPSASSPAAARRPGCRPARCSNGPGHRGELSRITPHRNLGDRRGWGLLRPRPHREMTMPPSGYGQLPRDMTSISFHHT